MYAISQLCVCVCCLQVVIKEKVLELLIYFTKHEDEEVKTKAIIGLGKDTIFKYFRFDKCRKVTIFIVCVFRKTDSMLSHCDVLEADCIAPAGGDRDVLCFYMSLLFIHFPQASL